MHQSPGGSNSFSVWLDVYAVRVACRLIADIQQRKANDIIRPVAVIHLAATRDGNAAAVARHQ
ncbi:hypothetical protein HJG40_14420 [Acidithiobacillus sp. ATCC 19703]|uniref:Uncharacterized protein n=1 Tax=Acidithiobacillus concretivorus TaxID=3063952 RepID=A0ABS5ZTH6_9PROT|nr:hypothetical protein [Acidithiobacillus concretivorus]